MKKILLICVLLFCFSCGSEKKKCDGDELKIICNNSTDEISSLVEASLNNYLFKVDNNWESLSWKSRYYIGDETLFERNNKLWASTEFYEELERIINSNIEEAKIIFNLENDYTHFIINDDIEDDIENIEDTLYDIYTTKDPEYSSFRQLIKEELTILIITYIISFFISLFLIKDLAATFFVATFIEIIVVIGFYMFSSPDNDVWKKEEISNNIEVARSEIKRISSEISTNKIYELCE